MPVSNNSMCASSVTPEPAPGRSSYRLQPHQQNQIITVHRGYYEAPAFKIYIEGEMISTETH